MKDLKMLWSKIQPAIPHLYFISILIWMASTNDHPNGKKILILLLPLIFQAIYRKKTGNVVLGLFLFLCAVYISLAFLSDVYKIQNVNTSLNFLIFGGTFVVFNFVMSLWMIGLSSLIKNLRQPALKTLSVSLIPLGNSY